MTQRTIPDQRAIVDRRALAGTIADLVAAQGAAAARPAVVEALRNALPEYAKDQKLNLGSLAAEPSLTVQQRAGTFIVSALASRNATVTRAILAEFGPQLSAEALAAAKGAAAQPESAPTA